MDGIVESIRRMTPEQLRLFKTQLPLRLKSMNPQDRQSVLRSLQGMPELSDVVGLQDIEERKPWQVPSDLPLWKKGLSYAFMPFSIAHEYAAKPAAAGLWGAGVSLMPGTQSGEAQLREARKGGAVTPWHTEFRGAYEEAKTPWGVKGALEMLPWLAIPTAGGVAAKLGAIGEQTLAGRVAGVAAKALKPAVTYEKALAYPITKPMELVGKAIAKRVTPQLVPDLRAFDEVVKVASQPDRLRSLASIPAFKPFAKVIGGLAATAQKPWEWAAVGRQVLRAEGVNKAKATVASLQRLGQSSKVFGLDEDGMMLLAGKKVHLNDVRANESYWRNLNPQQLSWVKRAQEIEDAKLGFLQRNKIDISELSFDEGGHYAGRRVYAKYNPEGELLDYGFVGAGPGRPGRKAAFEKERIFKTATEAIEQGYRYLPEEEALYLNTIAAYNRVADKQMGEWLLSKAPWRSTEVFSIPKANALINSALKREPIAESRLVALERDMPQVAESLRNALADKDWTTRFQALTQLKEQVRAMVPTGKEKLFWAVERITKERQTANYAIQVIQRAKRGETIPVGTVKAISKVIPGVRDKLSENTRFVLDDLIKAGEKAKEWPKTLEVPPIYLPKAYKARLAKAEARLAANPNDGVLFREVQKLKQKVAFTKYRLAKGEPIELERSPVGILTEDRQTALNELLDVVRGTPYKAETAMGKVVTKYRGGLLEEFRKKELEAIRSRKEVATEARRVKYGEAALADYPTFAGKIFTGPEAREMADFLRKELSPEFSNALHAVNQVNAVGRFFALAGDMSPFLIQLIFLAGYKPMVYGKAIKGFVQAMFDPQFHAKYLANNADVIARAPDLMLTSGGGAEFTEAMARGGWLRKGPMEVAGKPLVPFTRGFEAALDVAGIELRKSLDHLATSPLAASQVDSFINEFRGLQNTARIGVSTKQRQLEAAVTLAPKYNRAIAALLTDVIRGNLRGQLARRAIGQGIAAGAALGVAISYALGEGPDEIAEHFDPRSSKFMTWRMAGQNIGPGSKVRSLVALFGKSIDDPGSLVKGIDENPALAFVRGNMAPGPSTALDLLTGKNYVGDPTRDGLMDLTRAVVLENLTPLWVQSTLLESGGGVTGVTLNSVANFLGMRSYPMTPYQELELKRNELAQAEYGVSTWDDLRQVMGTNAQKKLEQKYPELVEMDKKVQERSRGEFKRWAEFEQQARDIDDDTFTSLQKADRYFSDTGDGYGFRNMVDDVMANRRSEFKNRERNFPDIVTSLEAPLSDQQKKGMFVGDLARRDYYKLMYADDMWDEYGRYKWDEADRREAQFVAQYGPEMKDYVEESFNIRKWSNLPGVKTLKAAQELVRPYWDIEDRVWAQYSPELRQVSDQITNIEKSDPRRAKVMLRQYPAIVWARKLILRLREQMRRTNPDIQAALNVFY